MILNEKELKIILEFALQHWIMIIMLFVLKILMERLNIYF